MSSPLKVGIWGLGRAGLNMHAPEIARFPELYVLHAGMDTEADRRDRLATLYKARVYQSEDELLKDPDIDVISIATRSDDHVKHCQRVLEQGKIAFLEKPIATSMADVSVLADLDRRYPGKIYLRHNRRFEAPFHHVREIMQSGVLGDVYEIKLCRHSYKRRSDWQTLIDCGGGQLNNWGPHIIDHALQFLDYDVKDIWSDLKRIAALGDAEDHLKIVFKGGSGLIVDLEISGGVAIPQEEYRVLGMRGALTCDGNLIRMRYIDPDQMFSEMQASRGNPPLDGGVANAYADLEEVRWIEKTLDVNPSTPMQMENIWVAMYQSIREGVPFPVTVTQGIAVVEVVEAVKRNTEFVRSM